MNNIRIGQYIPGNSWLHKLDPRIKLLSLVFLLAAIFIIPISAQPIYLIMMGLLLVFVLLLTVSSGIPLGKVLSGLRPVVFLLTFTFFIQFFYIQTGNPLASYEMHLSLVSIAAIILLIVVYQFTKRYIKFKIAYFILAVLGAFAIQTILPNIVGIYSYQLTIYDEALLRATFIFVRITNVIILTSLLTFTTSTIDLNYAIESLLRPLKVVKFPVDVIAMMLSLTLRSIPTLLGETDKIMKAQASRGVDFNESKLKDKVIQVVSLLIPVFVISFKRAEDLGNAMEVRGYIVGGERTKIDVHQIEWTDYIALIFSSVLLALIIYLRVF